VIGAIGGGWLATQLIDAEPTGQTIPTADDRPSAGKPFAERSAEEMPRFAGTPVTGETLTAVEVVERVSSAVVTVVNEQTVDIFGSDGPVPAGTGTGFIIDDQGHIVTNWHVVDQGEEFEVIFSDGERRTATLVGGDDVRDLAVVKVDAPVPGVVPLGDSSLLRPGEPVLAIGSALGTFTNTVTRGVVSALGRSIAEQEGSPELTGLIQHDAAINPGNSGGPLVNFRGEVIGVNTLGIPETPDGKPAQGLFFAIPSNTVVEIAFMLIQAAETR
jgi:2-alkenal reductase